MGAGCVCNLRVNPQSHKEGNFATNDFRLLSLSKNNMNDFKFLFNRISGTSDKISVHEAMVGVDTCQSSFVEKIFCTMSKSPNGCLDFEQFVFAVWNFCSLSFDMMGKIFVVAIPLL